MTLRCLHCGEPHYEEIALCNYCQYAQDPQYDPEEGDTGIPLAELRVKYGSQMTEVHGDPLLKKRAA